MNGSISHFRSFLAQFGADRRSVEQGNHLWLDGPAADLKEAMCREASRLYAPLNQVLQDLEIKYEEMIAAWHDFAVAGNITDATLPPAYQISDNTRHNLAKRTRLAIARLESRPGGIQSPAKHCRCPALLRVEIGIAAGHS